MRRVAALVCVAILGACAVFGLDSAQEPAPAPPPPRTAWIVGLDGRAIGQATFIEGQGGVLIRLEISQGGLTHGWHGLHLHQTGDCADAAASFQAAGRHAAHPGAPAQHGLLNPAEPEVGDLPNLFAPSAGPFGAEFFTQRVTLFPTPADGRTPLLDEDGAALVIHAGADDHVTQPAGGAGSRIACAALTRG